jgi:hypothetical protein
VPGSDTLWKLHKLNNVDKHRVLITAGSAFQSVNIGPHLGREMQKQLASTPLASKLSELPPLDLFLRPADRLVPLKQGDELFIDAPEAVSDEKLQLSSHTLHRDQRLADKDAI